MTKQPPFNTNCPQGGGFDFYDFKKALSDKYGDMFSEFFSMAFRDMSGEFLEQSSRFCKLVDWCDNEIRKMGAMANIFSPADKTEKYTESDFKLWRENIHTAAELVYLRALLLDHRTTTEQRQNIEYTICKLYGIHYSEYLEEYC